MRLRVIWKNGWAHLDGTGPDGRRIRRALKTRDPKRAEEARAHEETRLWKVGLYGAESVVTFDEAVAARKGAERCLGYHQNHGRKPKRNLSNEED